MPGLAVLTGATGFIGQHLAARLQSDGWRLRIFSRNPQAAQSVACAEAVTGDFAQTDKLRALTREADLIIHCAGAIKARSRADFDAANADSVTRLTEACAQNATKPRFVLLSTLAAREAEISSYAASKREGERRAEAGRDALSSLTMVRPPAVYGPGDRETLAFFKMLRSGFVLFPKTEAARLSLIHVADLVEAIAALCRMERPPEGSFEIADPAPEGYSWEEMIRAGEAAVGHSARRIVLSRGTVGLIAGAVSTGARLTGRLPMLSRDKVAELFHADWVARDRRLQTLLNKPPRIALLEGFRETAAWYRAQSWLKS
ncbi:MAG: NAD-dependent epimerase/dehydratase family protein [Rhodovibrionaceae bacterium]